MTDIVKRLRCAKTSLGQSLCFGLVTEAADEIERLRAEVARLSAPVVMEPVGKVASWSPLHGTFVVQQKHETNGYPDPLKDRGIYSAAQLASVVRERDNMLIAIADHVTARSDYVSRIAELESKLFHSERSRAEDAREGLELAAKYEGYGDTTADTIDEAIEALDAIQSTGIAISQIKAQALRDAITEWEKPYGLTDGTPFIDRLRRMAAEKEAG